MSVNKLPPIEAKQSQLFHFKPEDLTLITDKSHSLYDPRVEGPYDEKLVLSIMDVGIIEPIVVYPNGESGGVEVVDGRGRTKAALEANKRLCKAGKDPIWVPAFPRVGSDADLFGVLIAANEIRTEDSPINRAEKMRRLKNFGRSTAQIAVTFGMTRQNVENMLALDVLSDEVKAAVEADEIKATAALGLKALSHEEQDATLDALRESGEKPTVENVKEFVSNSFSDDEVPVVRFKAQPKKRLEARLRLFSESGFGRDRYLQSKPVDFQAGFEYALKWSLGQVQEEEPFEVEDSNKESEESEE